MMRPPTKPSSKRSSGALGAGGSSRRSAQEKSGAAPMSSAAGDLAYLHANSVRPQVSPLGAPFFETSATIPHVPIDDPADEPPPLAHFRSSRSRRGVVENQHPSPSPRRATPITNNASAIHSMSLSTNSRLNSTIPEFGVTYGGKNAYFNFKAEDHADLTATRVIAQERNRYEAFAAAQITHTALPSDLPLFVVLQHRYRDEFGKLGAVESNARVAIYAQYKSEKESLEEYERCKARSDMANYRHSVALGETLQRKLQIAIGKLLQEEPARRVVIITNEERVRACLGRWQKVEMQAVDLKERKQALLVFEERRRRVRVVEPEIREWDDIIHQIEISGLHRRAINPFGHCPFSGGGAHPDKCPFATPHGCHGLPINRKHYRNDHNTPTRGGTTLHLPPL